MGWRGLPSRYRELVLGDLNQPETLLERRIFEERPITVSIMGNMEARNLSVLPNINFQFGSQPTRNQDGNDGTCFGPVLGRGVHQGLPEGYKMDHNEADEESTSD